MIVDNLDRVPPKVGEHLFFDYGAQLQELSCMMIYTVPISVLCSPKNIANAFGEPHVMSMVGCYEFVRNDCDLAYNKNGLAGLKQIIAQRLDMQQIFAGSSGCWRADDVCGFRSGIDDRVSGNQ